MAHRILFFDFGDIRQFCFLAGVLPEQIGSRVQPGGSGSPRLLPRPQSRGLFAPELQPFVSRLPATSFRTNSCPRLFRVTHSDSWFDTADRLMWRNNAYLTVRAVRVYFVNPGDSLAVDDISDTPAND